LSKRVVVLGCAGSGKTTFSRQLGARLNIPVICLDAIWQPGGDISRFRATISPLHAGSVWISDGNFSDVTFDIRLPRATLIVWLERPRLLCLWRAFARVFRSGEPHKISGVGEVLAFIWSFNRINRPKIERNRLAYGPNVPVVTLGNSNAIAAFLSSAAATIPAGSSDQRLR
jgi:adenylate kinase family enzyme